MTRLRSSVLLAPLLCAALAGCSSGGLAGHGGGTPSHQRGTVTQTTASVTQTTASVTRTNAATPPTVDTAHLENAIAAAAQAQRHQRATVVCPSGIPIAPGRRFYCAAQTGKQVTPFLVTEQPHDQLSYTGVSDSQAPMLNMGHTELAVMQALHADHLTPTRVACPAQMPRQQGLEFVCVATLGTRSVGLVVRETNSVGGVSFQSR